MALKPVRLRSRVDLPDPDGPISPTISPRPTVSDTWSSARRWPKVLEASWTEKIASVVIVRGMISMPRPRPCQSNGRALRKFDDGAGETGFAAPWASWGLIAPGLQRLGAAREIVRSRPDWE